MSLDLPHWRSASDYDYIDSLTTPDLAWEWLRRNKQYQNDYASAQRSDEHPHDLTQKVRQAWGLRFPDRPKQKCVTDDRLLAA